MKEETHVLKHFRNYVANFFVKPGMLHKDRQDFLEILTQTKVTRQPSRSTFYFKNECDDPIIVPKPLSSAPLPNHHNVDHTQLSKLVSSILLRPRKTHNIDYHKQVEQEQAVDADLNIFGDVTDDLSFKALMGLDREDPLDIHPYIQSTELEQEAEPALPWRPVNLASNQPSTATGVEYDEYLEGYTMGEFGERRGDLDEEPQTSKRKMVTDPEALKRKRLAASRDFQKVMQRVEKGGLQSFK